MPVVSTYGPRKVTTAAIPGERLTAAQTPLSEGAGLAEANAGASEALAGLGGAVFKSGIELGDVQTQIRSDAQKQADEVAVINASNQLDTWENKRLYDPVTGALAQKGKAALPLPETIATEYKDVAGGIAQGLTTARQQMAFAKLSAQHEQNLDMTIRRHVMGEMQAYEGSELTAFVENKRSNAIANSQDPRRVFEELGAAVDAIHASAPRLGLGPEVVQHQVEATQTATHVGVIDSLLSQGQARAAQVYFEETKGQITGGAADKVQKAIAEGQLRGQAQQTADGILAKGGTLAEQRDQVKAITDPELRDAVQARIEHEASIQEKQQRDQEEATAKTAYDAVDRTHSVDSIPPATWLGLSGGTRSALHEYANRLAKGEPVETDPVKYYGLMQQASETPEAFVKVNLLGYKGSLDNATFKQLTDLQYSIRKGEREQADKVLSGFRTSTQLVDDALTSYGIDPATKDLPTKQSIAELRRMLDTRVQAQEALTGKKATNDDMQTTLDAILSQSRTTPGSWWGLVPFNGVSLSDTKKRLIDLTPADVPAADRTQIEDSLRRARLPVSDQTVLDVYLNHLAGKR